LRPGGSEVQTSALSLVKFSIVTPSFRQSDLLRLCVASVADQAGEGLEVEHIVQDAGSDDGTLDWLRSDARVKAFVEKDSGMYDAINRGLRRATGDLCAYLNCDEQYLPGTLEKVARFFTSHPAVEVLFGDALLTDAEGVPRSYRRVVLPLAWHVRLVHLPTLTCSTFFRRSVFERGHEFPPEWKAIGDGVWVHGMLKAGVPMAVLPEPLASFMFTGQNLGASERSLAEAKAFRGRSWHQLLAPLLVLHHRWRKWRAGAYDARRISTGLYLRKAPEHRHRFSECALTYKWDIT